ncbi:MAG: nitroreductase family deazaflavin-dependent oxidoreductase [Acidimicrobiales bacterium]
MPSDFALKTMNAVHRVILAGTGGKLGWKAMGMPVVELNTIGRKSGEPRRVMLTSPLQIGDGYVIVASRGGDDHHPAWFHNVQKHPDVTVKIDGKAQPMHARVATSAERAEWWPKLAAAHKNYAGYQRKTEREIPLVLLEPASPSR